MTESQRIWEAWYTAFTRLRDAPSAGRDIACPSCGAEPIRLAYTGDPDSRVGYVVVWCENCLKGIHLSRMGIPPGVEMFTFDTPDEERDAVVPDVQLIRPDPHVGDVDVP